MPALKIKTIFSGSFSRSAVFGLAAAGLFFGLVSVGHAQSERAGGERRSRFMERIDREEGARRLEVFRNLRLDGDFCFRFELTHKPRFGRNLRYYGTMWGTWNEVGPVTRVQIEEKGRAEGNGAVLEYIVQNGTEPAIWKREGPGEDFEKLEGAAIFEPVLPGLVYTPFDLQMPFIYWEEFEYEGPKLKGMSRVAQQFLMLPPAGSAYDERGIRSVRIGIDDTYNALWGVEVLGAEEAVLRSFSVESFKKVQDQYIVKRVSIFDTETRDKTSFEVEAASVGLMLNPEVFDPRICEVPPRIPEAMFEEL